MTPFTHVPLGESLVYIWPIDPDLQKMNPNDQVSADYAAAGYCFPLHATDAERALVYRRKLEAVEQQARQNPADINANIWFTNANFVLPFVDEITRLDAILEPVKSILGPDVLVWNASFFAKDAGSPDFVSWHQDLTYWGLDDVEETTCWLALSRASIASGCMKFVPGSHKKRLVPHRDTFDANNLLTRGQEVAVDVDEADAVCVELEPGQASMHHGHLFHASGPNTTDDRRIGAAIRYIKPSMKQRSGDKSLVALGYAGWEAGQLEAEMLHNTWLTVPASPDIIFDVPFNDRWSVAAKSIGVDISQMSPHAGPA